MKKLIVLSVFGLLVMALTTPVYAQKLDFRASGNIWVYSVWERFETQSATANVGIYNTVPTTLKPGGSQYNRTASWMSQRMRLKFDAVMGKEMSGTLFLEMDSGTWGDIAGSTAGGTLQRNNMGYWGGDRASVEIKNCYLDFGLPAVGLPYPVTVRAGVQPFIPRSFILGYLDAAGVTVGIDADPARISLIWAKGWEGNIEMEDDVNLYGIEARMKVDKFTVGGYGLFLDSKTYPFAQSTVIIPAKTTWNANMWWFGLYADGKTGPVDLNLDFIYDAGKVKHRLAPATNPEVKYRGWMGRARIDYPWEKFNFGIVGMYGSGADTRKTSSTGYAGERVNAVAASSTTTTPPTTAALSTKVNSFVNLPSGETGGLGDMEVFGPAFVTGATSVAGVNYGNTTGAFGRGSTGGIWYAKLYGSYRATPGYKITLQGIYIGDTTKNGNTFGTARQADRVTLRDDKEIGWEFDMIHEIRIYKNLIYRIGAGILFPGKALEFYNHAAAVQANEKIKNPFGVHTTLTYSF